MPPLPTKQNVHICSIYGLSFDYAEDDNFDSSKEMDWDQGDQFTLFFRFCLIFGPFALLNFLPYFCLIF